MNFDELVSGFFWIDASDARVYIAGSGVDKVGVVSPAKESTIIRKSVPSSSSTAKVLRLWSYFPVPE